MAQREAMKRGSKSMAAEDRAEPLANPTRVSSEVCPMRRARPVLAALCLLVLSSTAAAAAKPDRQPLEIGDFDFAAGEACPFAVHVEFLVNREKVTTFFDRDGNVTRILTTGSLVIRVSPVDEPSNTLTLNVSGPSHQVFRADGSSTLTYGGRSVSLFPPGTFVLTAGRAVVELDSAGEFVSVTNIGFETDVCIMLAP